MLLRSRLLLATLSLFALAPFTAVRAQDYAPPRFTDSDREKKVAAVAADIRKIYADFAADKHVPGLVWGIVLDGQLVQTGATGYADLNKKIFVGKSTGFRIASMSKSFTAMAILKLRDEGKLALDDEVQQHLPEFHGIKPLTADSPAITIRHLLGMGAGFPEDNPWGDRQLGITEAQFNAFLARGISFSNAPGVAYEYSNLGFALLGRIVSNVSGQPYQRYITREILTPLGMKDTRWDTADVPLERLALGYRWEKNTWSLERIEPDGVYGAMGGLVTTAEDFTRYIAFHLSAWPPRNDPDTGPVRRATLREMHSPFQLIGVNTTEKTIAGETNAIAAGYGFGLRTAVDAKGVLSSRHGGGLPGYGSEYRFFPEYGFGIFSFANLTYAGPGPANVKVAALLIEKAGLTPRALLVSKTLERRAAQLRELVVTWDEKLGAEILAENFFLDRTRTDWSEYAQTMLASAGSIISTGPVVPLNQLRGTFPLITEKGRVNVTFTLTPETPAKVQALRLTFVPKP
jgi:CubicO group peptidase (beta-lactamase class C family)